MADYRQKYELWKSDPFFDEATRAELAALTDEKRSRTAFTGTSSSVPAEPEASWAQAPTVSIRTTFAG